VSALTSREAAVLQLIARGCTYSQAAERLGISLHTVASHIKNAYRKLGVRSGAAAVMRAVELQLFKKEDSHISQGARNE
jgi:LuxR family maltose regulon positive regulatory protein